MKKLFDIGGDEMRRILSLHESATQRQYLNEVDSEFNPNDSRDAISSNVAQNMAAKMNAAKEQQQKSKNDPKLNYWFSNTLVAKFKLTEHFAVAGRSEYYGDPSNITIPTYTGGFNVFGNSINLDYTPQNNFLIRIEGRLLMADASIFLNKGKTFQNKNSFVSTSFSYQF
jgi:hypothetical protein